MWTTADWTNKNIWHGYLELSEQSHKQASVVAIINIISY